jgi:hypothetical protein
MAKAAPITLAEVLEKLHEKLDEAADFLEELEEAKKDRRHFTHRISAFLSATGSVILMIETHAKRYARERGKEAEFTEWYETKKDAFRTPNEASKSKKPVGRDRAWVYLRVARDDTIHIEQTNLNRLARLDITMRLHVADGIRVTEHREDGPVIVVDQPPKSVPSPEPDEVHIEENLWAFSQIVLVDKGRNITNIVEPPTDDVITVCGAHVERLISLVDECKNKLFEITTATYSA